MYTFEHLVAFTFQGVSASALPDECETRLSDPFYACTITIVRDPRSKLLHADQEQAVRAGMMRGVTFDDEEFDDVLAEVRATRPHAAGYVIATIRGPANLDMSQTHRDFGQAVVGFDLANKDDYREMTRPLAAAVGAALALVSFPARPEKVADSVYFFDSAGRPHYVSNPRFGNATLSFSWGETELTKFRRMCHAAAANTDVARPIRLLASTLNPDVDPLEKFVALWSGLEVLVNKLFPSLRQQFVAKDEWARLGDETAQRVRDDRAKLVDKFAVIASVLLPDTATTDTATFASVKDLRDQLLHAGEIADGGVPLEAIRDLLVRYLEAHLAGS